MAVQQEDLCDAVFRYFKEFSDSVVSATGSPNDKYHVGKLIMKGLQDAPDFVLQIDAASGESETCKSVLNRSIRCAVALQKLGIQYGDVITQLAPNHLDACIAYYATTFCGICMCSPDRNMTINELKLNLNATKPKLVLCQKEKVKDVLQVVEKGVKIVTFDDSSDFTFNDLLNLAEEEEVSSFKPNDFDPATTLLVLAATSGSTGSPKIADITHKQIISGMVPWWSALRKFPEPTRTVLVWSPLQWLSAVGLYLLSPILRLQRLQTSADLNLETMIPILKKYRPTYAILNPSVLISLINADKDHCDPSSFELIMLGGSNVPQDVIPEFKKLAPKCQVYIVFGLTEAAGIAFLSEFKNDDYRFSEMSHLNYRLVDPDTLKDVTKPNVPGELWIQGPSVFSGYHNDPSNTKDIITNDNWLRTGDIMYKDQNGVYRYVERLKLLLKYRGIQITPTEVETVIRQLPAVMDVAVLGVPDKESGDLPVACVTVKPGCSVSAQEIKDIVKNSLSDHKQLRGGVVFLQSMPLLATLKVDRKKLKEIVLSSNRE